MFVDNLLKLMENFSLNTLVSEFVPIQLVEDESVRRRQEARSVSQSWTREQCRVGIQNPRSTQSLR